MTNNQDILKALLTVNTDVRKKVAMPRFGFDFEIKALTGDEMTKIQERATKHLGKGKKKLDEDKLNYLIIAKACIVPNWEDPALLEACETPDAVDVIKSKLLFGEIATLLGEIGELNGFDKTDEEEIEEIKN